MTEFRLKLCFLFILPLVQISFGFDYNEEGCTVLKTWERAGFACSSVNLTVMNENLDAILKKVKFIIERFSIFFFFSKMNIHEISDMTQMF